MVEQFFQVLSLFLVMVCLVVTLIQFFTLPSMISSYREAKKNGQGIDVDVGKFFVTVMLPLLYLISYGLVNFNVV